MKRHLPVIGCLTLAGLILLPAASASADGGRGSSYCSNSGPPTGEYAGDLTDADGHTYGNAGEIISWFSQQTLRPLGPWGQAVRDFCDPTAP